MERLCDEILQLVFYELFDPSPLTLVSRRFRRFSQDPYVRAHYFLIHYGATEAMYYALGRGKVLTERVLDILLTSGAHLSRYLVQVAMHHFFYTQAHFIKTLWVRNIPLKVFTHFLKLAEEIYGEIPRGKGEDDGSVFTTFLRESRFLPDMKSVTWEDVKELMETFHFIPFYARDPIMAQFPLALAVEPRLLPYAAANGFSMDYKDQDFVFRKMFERPSVSSEIRAENIADNVKELLRLDPSMFVSRTVAAEVCMEAKTNDIGYGALKRLDKSGHLKFELSILVEDLLKTFLTTRSISNVNTGDTLLHLFTDFPSTDVSVRVVILVVVFIAAEQRMSVATIRSKLETLGLTPITRRDAFNVLVNPFTDRYSSVIEFSRQEVVLKGDGSKGMNTEDIDGLVHEVAAKCLEIACKGKLLKRLCDGFPSLEHMISKLVLQKYQLSVEDVPSWEDGSYHYIQTKLSRDFLLFGVGTVHTIESLMSEEQKEPHDMQQHLLDTEGFLDASDLPDESEAGDISTLGAITQESLTTMIRHDEATPVRSRRRYLHSYGSPDLSGKLRYPHDSLHVGKWVKLHFGTKSAVTAIFMTHAIVNNNSNMLHTYLMHSESGLLHNPIQHVPVTLKHFQFLARMGRAPNFHMYHAIELGAEFYVDENDYIPKANQAKKLDPRSQIKTENHQTSLPLALSRSPSPPTRGRKRPRRSAATAIRSYAIPDSDDEDMVVESLSIPDPRKDKKQTQETNMQLWIKHLSDLLRIETRKYAARRKRLEKDAQPGEKIRVYKNEFVKSLTSNLRAFRKVEAENLVKGCDPSKDTVYSSDEDEEYMTGRVKRRKVTST